MFIDELLGVGEERGDDENVAHTSGRKCTICIDGSGGGV